MFCGWGTQPCVPEFAYEQVRNVVYFDCWKVWGDNIDRAEDWGVISLDWLMGSWRFLANLRRLVQAVVELMRWAIQWGCVDLWIYNTYMYGHLFRGVEQAWQWMHEVRTCMFLHGSYVEEVREVEWDRINSISPEFAEYYLERMGATCLGSHGKRSALCCQNPVWGSHVQSV